MTSPLSYLFVFVGGGLGAIARMALSLAIAERFPSGFPWGTLAVNISGSFTIGLLDALLAPEGRLLASPEVRQFLFLGLLGGYTTFSSFSLQTLALLRDGQLFDACSNIAASVTLCLFAVWVGSALGHSLNALR